ncbi:MAG: glycoside hydrolase family 92 protein [Chitinophagaceae bacterium]|nr:glycoside hydrolase family 92 protein [Chitinophagaceae bacterium]
MSFSALGFYPVCPGTDQYVLGSPLFKKVTVTLENGKQLQIAAPDNASDKRYVKSLKVNDRLHAKNWISHSEILKGMKLQFSMSATPRKNKRHRRQ